METPAREGKGIRMSRFIHDDKAQCPACPTGIVREHSLPHTFRCVECRRYFDADLNQIDAAKNERLPLEMPT